MKRFRGGLVFQAHRLLYHSTLGSRVIKKKKVAGETQPQLQLARKLPLRILPLRIDFVDFDVLKRIVGVGPCHPQARTGVVLLTLTYEQRTPPAVVQGAAPGEWLDASGFGVESLGCRVKS